MLKMWAIAPTYLDTRMLLDMWSAGLRLLSIISGQGKMTSDEERYYLGYPMYQKLMQQPLPKIFLGQYLAQVGEELILRRNVEVDMTPIRDLQATPGREQQRQKIAITTGQLEYEKEFLLKRTKKEDPLRMQSLKSSKLHAFKNMDVQAGYVASNECEYIQRYCKLGNDKGFYSYHN